VHKAMSPRCHVSSCSATWTCEHHQIYHLCLLLILRATITFRKRIGIGTMRIEELRIKLQLWFGSEEPPVQSF